MKNIEIEYKVLINKEGYEKLLLWLKNYPIKNYEQTNYYYDSKTSILKQNNLSLRIRYYEKEKKYLATLKEKISEGRIEYEDEMLSNNLNDLPKDIKDVLNEKKVFIDDLKLKGSLKTNRNEIIYQDTLLCLDYNQYNNKFDYEVECEAKSMTIAKNIIVNLLKELEIEFQESLLSKQARALSL